MKAQELAVFVNSISNYFTVTTDEIAKVGTPFLSSDIGTHINDFTGVIRITGDYKGSVFFSAPGRMLMHCLRCLGLSTTQDSKLLDLVGEISNTVSGNARSELGEGFLISTPTTIQGIAEDQFESKQVKNYVIPIEWHMLTANLIVNISEKKPSHPMA